MADKEIKSRILDDVGNIINEITTRVVETQDEFIFQTISGWWMHETQRHISKQELINALTLNKEIVRCKDCIHWKSEDGKFGKCKICHSVSSSNGWFCADGKRREAE